MELLEHSDAANRNAKWLRYFVKKLAMWSIHVILWDQGERDENTQKSSCRIYKLESLKIRKNHDLQVAMDCQCPSHQDHHKHSSR